MSKKPDNFKQKLDELESIIDWFESEDIDLDTALDSFERGLKLADELKAHLETAENRFSEIKQKFDIENETDIKDAEEK